MATRNIRAAIEASMSDLAPHLPQTSLLPDGASYTLRLAATSELGPRLRRALYELFDSNMFAISKGTSMTYTRASKQAEMFDPITRFLLLLRADTDGDGEGEGEGEVAVPPMPGAMPARTRNGKGKERATGDGVVDMVDVDGREELLGFLSFRFDTEETLGSRDAEVIYCYEIHLAPGVRGLGLGHLLLDEFEAIGRRRNMDKGMLTCLAGNTTALRFYEKHGYKLDEIDPTRMDEDEWEDVGADGESTGKEPDGVDYHILSKDLR